MTMHCEHYEDCGNEAVYELTSAEDGRTIHVCERCDDDYSSCEVCGKQGVLQDNMSFWHGADEWPTCYPCQEKLRQEAKSEMMDILEEHIASFMLECKDEVPKWFKETVIDDAALIWEEEKHGDCKLCVKTAFAFALAEYFTSRLFQKIKHQ